MTENKRFHFGYVLGDVGLIDEQAELKWFIENCCSVSDLKKNWITVCDKLNEVADENEQLKSEISNKECVIQYLKTALNTDYYKESQHYKKEFIRLCEELAEENQLYKKVKDENEQLKYSLSAHMVDLNNYKGKCSTLELENEQFKQLMMKYEIDTIEKLDQVLFNQRVW